MAEPDPFLRRIERMSIVSCGVMAAAAWAIGRGRVEMPIAVVGGGLLAAISYRGIKAGIDAVAGMAAGGTSRAGVAIGLVKFFTRYAILAAAAYVIMARLVLPPVAVIAGASSLVVAVAIEACRPRRTSGDSSPARNSPT
jgi:hypothetical protein